MTGGLIQLASYGGADIYITGNPEITFFKTVYRRHTNFAKECIIQHIDGIVGYARTVNVDITRAGDLLGAIWLQMRPPIFNASDNKKWYYAQDLGNSLIKRVDLVIGGQLIDRQYGEWMHIWEELTVSTGRRPGLDAMTLTNVEMAKLIGITDENDAPYLNIPLQFWFCRNPGLALPLVAMSLHEVRLQIQFGSLEDITNSYKPSNTSGYAESALVIPNDTDMQLYSSGQTMECEVWATYYHLDTDERRSLTQKPLEYLIELTQFKGIKQYTDAQNIRYDLSFANPVKEVIWGIRPVLHILYDTVNNYTSYRTRTQPTFGQYWGDFTSGVIKFNGQERFKNRDSEHFLLTQNFQRHTRIPRYNKLTGAETVTISQAESGTLYVNKLYTYSFGLNPEKHQPSGTANFSKLDDACLELKGVSVTDPITNNGTGLLDQYINGLQLIVYATNYNVLRVKDGMAGLAFDI